MSVLTDDQIKEIARNAAAQHGVRETDVVLAPSIASTGAPALEIKYILPPGSVITASSSATVSQVIMNMADANDDRIPIVRYAASRP
jgi:CBS domain-containing protein